MNRDGKFRLIRWLRTLWSPRKREIPAEQRRAYRFSDYRSKIKIPDSVKHRKVWLISSSGKTAVQVDYLLARRIRAERYWYVNLRYPVRPDSLAGKFVPVVVAAAILIGVIQHLARDKKEATEEGSSV